MGSGGTPPNTLHLGIAWRKVVKFTPQIFPMPTGQVDAWGSEPVFTQRRKFLPQPRIEHSLPTDHTPSAFHIPRTA